MTSATRRFAVHIPVHKLAMARVDFNITDKLQLSVRYYPDRSHSVDQSYESSFTPASPLNAATKGDLAGLQFSAAISPRMFNVFHFGFSQRQTNLSGAGSDAPQLVAVNTPLSIGGGVPEFPERRANRGLVFADTLSYVVGAHSLSTGAQVIRRNEQYISEGMSQGRIYYADALALVTDGALSAGDPSRSIVRAELQQSPELERYRFTDLYAFANDSWRAST